MTDGKSGITTWSITNSMPTVWAIEARMCRLFVYFFTSKKVLSKNCLCIERKTRRRLTFVGAYRIIFIVSGANHKIWYRLGFVTLDLE